MAGATYSAHEWRSIIARPEDPLVFTVTSNSMLPLLARGTRVRVAPLPAGGLVPGQIGVFVLEDRLTVHRYLGTSPDGERFRGDNNLDGDPLVPLENIVGLAVAFQERDRMRTLPDRPTAAVRLHRARLLAKARIKAGLTSLGLFPPPTFHRLLIRMGLDRVWFDPDDRTTWNTGSLLASQKAESLSILLERFNAQQGTGSERLQALGLASGGGFLHQLLMSHGLDLQEFGAALSQDADEQWPRMVARSLALKKLGESATAQGREALLIKGAAMALTVYPQESLRTSGDIDVVVGMEQAESIDPEGFRQSLASPFGHIHIPARLEHGFVVEYHFRFGRCPSWGSNQDLLEDSTVFRPGLRVPAPRVSLTICLLHLAKHNWSFWDTIDISLLLRRHEWDWPSLVSFWRERGLLPLVLPSLILLEPVLEEIPDGLPQRLERTLGWKDRRFIATVVDCLRTSRFQRIKTFHLTTYETRMPFLRKCLKGFISTREASELRGEADENPLARWYRHAVGYRLGRLGRVLRDLFRTGK